jgi:redox-sensitive bicupin YhaK (pirin superfamily)
VRAEGGRFHGLQIWVALARDEEDCEPSFELLRASGVVVSEAPGVRTRHLLGGGARTRTHAAASTWLSDVEIAPLAAFAAPACAQGALYVVEGALAIDGHAVEAGHTATFGEGDARLFVARERTRAVAFGGDRVGPRYLWWNYVHSTKERIEHAKAEWREKRFALPADDRDDVIPLPADHERPLRLLNAG